MTRWLLIWSLTFGMAAEAFAQTPGLRDADAHFQAKRWSEAERAYLAILKTDSTSSMAWYRLGRLYLEGKSDAPRARRYFEGALKHGFAPPFFPQFGIARTLVVQNKRDDAMKILEQVASTGFSQNTTITGDTILNRLSTHARYAGLLETMKKNSEPCEHLAEARQFDFWIGTWDVFATSGVQQGTNRIDKILRGCALQENWTGGLGREGKSINFFDPQRKTWRQVWVADANSVLDYTAGRFSDNAMVFTGTTLSPNGDTVLQKLTFKKLHADTVHQIFEQSVDRGQSWTQTWFGIYVRRR